MLVWKFSKLQQVIQLDLIFLTSYLLVNEYYLQCDPGDSTEETWKIWCMKDVIFLFKRLIQLLTPSICNYILHTQIRIIPKEISLPEKSRSFIRSYSLALKSDLTLHVLSKSPLVNCNSSWAFDADNIVKLRSASSIRELTLPFNSYYFRLAVPLPLLVVVYRNVAIMQRRVGWMGVFTWKEAKLIHKISSEANKICRGRV